MRCSAAVVSSRTILYFPDVLHKLVRESNENDNDDDDEDDDAFVSEIFFELANASEIAYRVGDQKNLLLVFEQDVSACGEHTGGIIWETSYLLLQYLLHQQHTANSYYLGRTLELGAGVGFLGQCLMTACCCKSMVQTETPQVLVNLKANYERNQSILQKFGDVFVCALDWTTYKQHAAAAADLLLPHSFDTLLGTDVIFAPHLVEPLLQTAAFMAHVNTVWYLCVQIRCAVSHALFLEQAPAYGFVVQDVSEAAFAMPECAWGKALECFLFRITRATKSSEEDVS